MTQNDGGPQTSRRTTETSMRELAIIPLGIALNLALGTVVQALKLPVFLDAVGTIVVTLIAGLRAGVATGVLSFLIGGVLVNPVLPWFSGTQAVIALYTHLAARVGLFRNAMRTMLAGVGLGISAAAVSAPVIVYIFGGITGSGESVITAFLMNAGHQLVKSVVLAGLSCEPLDKTLQCLLATWLLRGVPRSVLEKYTGPYLALNRFVRGGTP